MKRAMEILNASFLWRCVDAFCAWMGRQWERSALVHWFLHPAPWGQAASEHSIFFKLWELIRGGLCKLFALLRLDKLFEGSVFGQSWLWCLIPVVLAPIVPTMLVLALVVRVLPVYVAKQQLDTYAVELVREAEIAGRVGTETNRRAAALTDSTGLDPDIRWSRTGRIQLNDEVTVTLTLDMDIGLFGGLGSFPITLTAEATGKSEVYWK